VETAITVLRANHQHLTPNLTQEQIPIAVTAVHAEEEGVHDAAVDAKVDANPGQPPKSSLK